MQTAKDLLMWSLAHPGFVSTVPVSDIRDVMVDSARGKINSRMNGSPPVASAYVKIGVDDRIVVALRGKPEKSPYVFLLVAVPTQALELAREDWKRRDSPIIIPTPEEIQ